MAYFNTTHVRGQQLADYEAKTDSQEIMILQFFKANKGSEWTPEDIHQHHGGFHSTPLTSIRRAFSNLQRDGFIEKTDNQVEGMYGRPVYTWRVKIREGVQNELFS